MHKDLNPSNILWNRETGVLRVIDFGISTELSRETPAILHPNVLEGTLAYMSPEQTGRMNRALDYRTDLYSLGVTFYQLLTTQLPFASQDPMELVHFHIARVPTPAHEVNPELPLVISQILGKLLQKRAEERYQSAAALEADLVRCVDSLAAAGAIAHFPIATDEVSAAFQIPQQLYGREREVKTLLDAFDRVSGGTREMMLVAGQSGIGKSALVHEVHKPIVRQRGFFISGKFDQFNRNIPYASLIQAFQGLVQQLLTESEERLAAWSEKIASALGPNGQVIVQVIPEVELIVGPQPALPELPPAEAQNRFNMVFERFVRTFAAADHPLAIFLDDLQWADAPSLRLLELLMSDGDTKYMFLIGAYRDNEVDGAHPLTFTLDEMKKASAVVHRITLGPLHLGHCVQLIGDTLRCDGERALPLAEICVEKTGGNPFFLNQFLLALHDEGLIDFDLAARAWRWDTARILAKGMTDNVVTLMVAKLQKQPPDALAALRMAACIGASFDLRTLASVSGRTPADTATALWPGLREGLVLPVGDAYKFAQSDEAAEGGASVARSRSVVYRFLHDRVQQAACSLIADGDKRLIHLQVGRCMREDSSPAERQERLFAIVNHMNLGSAALGSEAERDDLAQLNLGAAQKAKASVAHGNALACAKAGLALLGEGAWERQHDLALALHVEAAEGCQLTTDFDPMGRYVAAMLAQPITLLDRVRVYEILIAAAIAKAELGDGIAKALEILALLGVDFPADPQPADVMAALGETMGQLQATGLTVEQMAELPEVTDPTHRAARRILTNITSAAYVGRPALFPLIVFKAVGLAARVGNSTASAYSYSTYGIILCGVVGDMDAGYRFGQMAIRVSDRFNAKEYEARTKYITCTYIRFWKEHLREPFRTFPSLYQAALETGDHEFAAWSLMMRSVQGIFLGLDLQERTRETVKYLRILRQLKLFTALRITEQCLQVIHNLTGQSADPRRVVGEAFDEDRMLPVHIAAAEASAICNLLVNKMMLCYLFGDPAAALASADALAPYLSGMVALIHVPVFQMYDSLSRLAVLGECAVEERAAHLARVAAQQEALKKCADHAPMNFLHKHTLVEAERARADGRKDQARALYRRAIELARENDFQQEEALGNELLGRFWLADGEPELAGAYLAKARHLYRLRGATAKVAHLEARHPELLAAREQRPDGARISTTTTQDSSGALDLVSVLKASQAIAGEVALDEVLKKIVIIASENAGAARGLLLLERDGALGIEVEIGLSEGVALRHGAPVTGSGALSEAIARLAATRERRTLPLRSAPPRAGRAGAPSPSAPCPSRRWCRAPRRRSDPSTPATSPPSTGSRRRCRAIPSGWRCSPCPPTGHS